MSSPAIAVGMRGLGREPTLVPVTDRCVGVRLVARSGAPRQRRRRLKKGQRPTVARIRQQLQGMHGHRRRLVLGETALLPCAPASAARPSARRSGGSCPLRRRRESPRPAPTRAATGAPNGRCHWGRTRLSHSAARDLGRGDGAPRRASARPAEIREAGAGRREKESARSLRGPRLRLPVYRRIVVEWHVEPDLGPRRDRGKQPSLIRHQRRRPQVLARPVILERGAGAGEHQGAVVDLDANVIDLGAVARPPGSPSGRPA